MGFRKQILCASGEPRTRLGQGWAKWLVALWLPVPHGKRVPRDMQARPSSVGDATPLELQALADGVILETTAVFQFPLTMPMGARREAIGKAWREQCLKHFGAVPEATGELVTTATL